MLVITGGEGGSSFDASDNERGEVDAERGDEGVRRRLEQNTWNSEEGTILRHRNLVSSTTSNT